MCVWSLTYHKQQAISISWLHCILSRQQHSQWDVRLAVNRLTALFPGIPGWARTRKVKPMWILLKQETVSGSGISWDICKSAPRGRQITTPAPHHSVFLQFFALPAAQPTASKHWLINKAYLDDITATNIYKSFAHKMVLETSWHRCGTKSCHCHPVYTLHACDVA